MLLTVLTYSYLAGLFGWFILHLWLGDSLWWLFLVNSLGPYLFAPLPFAVAAALVMRRADVGVGCAAALALFLYLYGGLFLRGRARSATRPGLTVMSFNVLAFRRQASQLIAALRTSGADVIALQELNPTIARALGKQLAAAYPYQLLERGSGVSGMGLLSRYPLRRTNDELPGPWIDKPQIVTLDLAGAPVTIINIHNVSLILGGPRWHDKISLSIKQREGQARRIVAFAAAHPGPCIVMGDFNTTDGSGAYRIITAALRDSWRDAGFGFGHTFPGGSSPGATRLTVLGIPLPSWLARIDYIFHSRSLVTIAAHIGPWDGVSDHRPVLVQVALVQ